MLSEKILFENPLRKASYPQYENVFHLIELAIKQFPNRMALAMEEEGKSLRLSYQDLMTMIKEVSEVLRSQGVQEGMRIVLLSENRPELVVVYLAILRLQAIAVILDTNLASNDYADLIQKSDPSLIITSQKLSHKINFNLSCPLWEIAKRSEVLPLNRTRETFFVNSETKITAIFSPSEKEVSTILFTSGTTGDFKGVLLTHRNLLFAIESAQHVIPYNYYHKTVCILPVFHIFGLICGLLTPFSIGASVIFVEKLAGQDILKAMQEYDCTVLSAVPRVLELFVANIKLKVSAKNFFVRVLFNSLYQISRISCSFGNYNLGKSFFKSLHKNFGGHLQLIVSGGASLDKKIFKALQILGFEVIEGYGLTETASLVTVNPFGKSRPGTVGLTIPKVDISIYNANAMGEGEVIVRGPNIMKGYFRNAEATEWALRDGWLHTGDLGKFDGKKYLVITGRIKEIIVKTNGEKAMPEDVERRYQNIPGIAGLAIVGMPAKTGFGEEIHAAIIPEHPNSLAQQQIKQLILERSKHVPSNLRIQECHFVTDIPKTSTLKVKRKVLVSQLLAQQGKNIVTSNVQQRSQESEIENRVYKIINNFLQLVLCSPAIHLKSEMSLQFDLGLDSLHRIELINLIQKEFAISFDEQQLAVINTIADLIHAVESLRAASHPIEPGALNGIEKKFSEHPKVILPQNHRKQMIQKILFFWIKKFVNYYFKLEVKGKENLPTNVPFIICANHTSHLDSASIAATCDFPLHELAFMAAKDYHFDRGLKSKIANVTLNLIPFERNIEMLGMIQGMQYCHEHMLQGNKLIIFPEGTRSLDGKMQKFKSAVAMIAFELNLTIVPAFITGAYECLPKGKRIPKKGKITVRYGKPLMMQTYRSLEKENYEIYKMILQDLRQSIESLAN